MKNNTCIICKEPTTDGDRFCSNDCKQTAIIRIGNHAASRFTCAICGDPLPAKAIRRHARTCGNQCRTKLRYRQQRNFIVRDYQHKN